MNASVENLVTTAAPEGAAVVHRDLRSEYGLACPQCGQAQTLKIVISSDATITADGIDNDDHLFWDGDNRCWCPACSYGATVAAFSTEKGSAQAPAQTQALKKYRVSFTDCRNYYYDIEAVSEDAAQEARLRLRGTARATARFRDNVAGRQTCFLSGCTHILR